MKISFISLILLIASQAITAQTKVWEKRIPLQGINEIIGIKDPETGGFNFLLESDYEITPINIDANFENSRTGWVTATGNRFGMDKPANNRYYIGNILNEDVLTVFFGNGSNKSFAFLTMDFKTKKYIEGTLPIDMEGEKYAQSFTHNNKFYVINSVKNTSILNLYIFSSDQNFEKRVLDYSSTKFQKGMNSESTLFDVLKVESSALIKLEVRLDLAFVDQFVPIPLSTVSKKANLYKSNDQMYLTVDNRTKNTTVLSFSLTDDKQSSMSFEFVGVDCGTYESERTMNSYIYDNKLFQLSVCSGGLMVSIYDLESKKLIKQYSASKDEEILFRNSDFFLEATNSFWGERGKTMLGSDTRKIIAKIRRGDAALTVREIENNLELKLGGYREVENNTSAGGGLPLGGGFLLSPSYKTSDERDYFFKSYLNKETLEHNDIKISADVNQIVGKFKAENKIKDVTETIFGDGITTYWSYYDPINGYLRVYKID